MHRHIKIDVFTICMNLPVIEVSNIDGNSNTVMQLIYEILLIPLRLAIYTLGSR